MPAIGQLVLSLIFQSVTRDRRPLLLPAREPSYSVGDQTFGAQSSMAFRSHRVDLDIAKKSEQLQSSGEPLTSDLREADYDVSRAE